MIPEFIVFGPSHCLMIVRLGIFILVTIISLSHSPFEEASSRKLNSWNATYQRDFTGADLTDVPLLRVKICWVICPL
jgi:hypothetical protein